MLDTSKMAMGGRIAIDIMVQAYKACESLGAGPDLLCILGSYGDTLEDHEILAMLKDYNAGRTEFDFVVADVDGREDKKQ